MPMATPAPSRSSKNFSKPSTVCTSPASSRKNCSFRCPYRSISSGSRSPRKCRRMSSRFLPSRTNCNSAFEEELQFVLDGRKREDILRQFLGDLDPGLILRYGHRKDQVFWDEAGGV